MLRILFQIIIIIISSRNIDKIIIFLATPCMLLSGLGEGRASQVALVVKNPPPSARNIRDAGSIPGSGRFPEGGNGNPLQCSCPENPVDRVAWRATVYGVAESDMTECAHTHIPFLRLL